MTTKAERGKPTTDTTEVPDGDRGLFNALLRVAVPDERESRPARRRKGKKEKVQD